MLCHFNYVICLLDFSVLAIGKILCIASKMFSNKNIGYNNTCLKHVKQNLKHKSTSNSKILLSQSFKSNKIFQIETAGNKGIGFLIFEDASYIKT